MVVLLYSCRSTCLSLSLQEQFKCQGCQRFEQAMLGLGRRTGSKRSIRQQCQQPFHDDKEFSPLERERVTFHSIKQALRTQNTCLVNDKYNEDPLEQESDTNGSDELILNILGV